MQMTLISREGFRWTKERTLRTEELVIISREGTNSYVRLSMLRDDRKSDKSLSVRNRSHLSVRKDSKGPAISKYSCK